MSSNIFHKVVALAEFELLHLNSKMFSTESTNPFQFFSSSKRPGGLLQLVDESLKGSCVQGIAFCRPPGHHAGASSSTGFCLVNNVALAARYALNKHLICALRIDSLYL